MKPMSYKSISEILFTISYRIVDTHLREAVRAFAFEVASFTEWENKMTKKELIVKQQLEIESLKTEISDLKNVINEVRNQLWRPEQWSTQCPDFPKVAMAAIVRAMRAIDDI